MKFAFVAIAAAMLSTSASAAVVTLDFEGIGNLAAVGDFYAPDYTFSPATLAVIDADAGGLGNIANEPSPSTVMFFLDSNNAVLNATNGFVGGFSFFYSSATAASVTVYAGANATGKVLGVIDLSAQFDQNCVGDPTGGFCNWTAVGVAFEGTAYSIDFGGTANQTAFDNITFGSETPGGVVPEPASWAMMILGFGLVGASMRRRRIAHASA